MEIRFHSGVVWNNHHCITKRRVHRLFIARRFLFQYFRVCQVMCQLWCFPRTVRPWTLHPSTKQMPSSLVAPGGIPKKNCDRPIPQRPVWPSEWPVRTAIILSDPGDPLKALCLQATSRCHEVTMKSWRLKTLLSKECECHILMLTGDCTVASHVTLQHCQSKAVFHVPDVCGCLGMLRVGLELAWNLQ